MTVTLKPEQRDALFAQISVDLDALGDLAMAISKGEEEECYLLGRRVADALRLVIEGGLGWREQTQGPTDLTLCHQEIRRIMTRLQGDVMAAIERARPDHDATRAEWEELEARKNACQFALDQASSPAN
jgi:hypothetical protein